jgi:hypothetical protein
MRALCGAIITAGALIGLGLLAIGMGIRYTEVANREEVYFGTMDNPLIFAMVFLVSVALIGLGISFLGLAFHHERRYRERQHDLLEQEKEPETTTGRKSKK